jgi:WD repeat-containing protein 45
MLTDTPQVFLWEVIKKKPVSSISVKTPVRAVCLNREKVIVVLQNSVEFHAPWNRPKDMQKVAVYETADNLHGLICMSAKHIAFPGPTAGHVRLVELATDNVSIIPAHSTALRAMAFSEKGDMLATASEKVGLHFQPTVVWPASAQESNVCRRREP